MTYTVRVLDLASKRKKTAARVLFLMCNSATTLFGVLNTVISGPRIRELLVTKTAG